MTNSKWFGTSDADPIADILRRLNAVENYANDLERKIANFDSPQPLSRVDPVSYMNPFEGQRAIDPADEQHMWYSNGEWRKASGTAIFEIKVFEDDKVVEAGDGKFKFDIPSDLDDSVLVDFEAWVTGASGGGDIIVSLYNNTQTQDMLSTPATIDAGQLNDKDSGTPFVIDTPNATVAYGDELWINVDSAGGGALGLGVKVAFAPAAVAAIILQGAQGPPGGIQSFQGSFPGGADASGTPGGPGSAWTTATGYDPGDVVLSGGTYYVTTVTHTSGALTEPGVGANWMTVWSVLTYQAGDLVTHNGVTYVAIQDHTATAANEPGVGVDQADFWVPVAEVPLGASANFNIASSSGAIPDGEKGAAIVPFDATIVSATILADQATDAEVDIWKSDFGGYPPNSGDSIVAAAPPSLVGSIKNIDSTLTGWDTSISEGDILVFHISGVTNARRITLGLQLDQ